MSIRKGPSIIAGNVGQNVDSALSPTSGNPVQNSVITQAIQNTIKKDNITNCITEIPQDIKLELSGTTLTLKAGSKMYYPNGFEADNTTLHFDSFTTTSDLVLSIGGSGWTNEKHMIVVNNDGTSSSAYAFQDIYSGSTAPATLASQYGVWYDTTNNLIRRTIDTGSTWTSTPYSFPICIAINTGGNCDSVYQIFNGFGYIGSTVFALSGLEYLCSNGRNSDGTLNNAKNKLTTCVVKTETNTSFSGKRIIDIRSGEVIVFDTLGRWFIQEQEPPRTIYNIWENPATNEIYQYLDGVWNKKTSCVLGITTETAGKIDSFSRKQVFRAVDYSDTEYIAHQAMPTNKYTDFTMGATGTLYTAPADGYIYIRRTATTAGKYLAIIKYLEGNVAYEASVMWAVAAGDLYVNAQISKGEQFAVTYNAEGGGGSEFFRFIYANGAV